MDQVIGKEGITARVLADSVAWVDGGPRLTTFEIEYPRYILAELNTHKMLSKNSASSRAIPIATMLEMISTTPAMPVHWGQNQPGMSARAQLEPLTMQAAQLTWIEAMKQAVSFTKILSGIGLHKQVANRVAEPWQRMKTVISGTEWANFFHLRDHEDAQPEFHELAHVMRMAFDQSKPQVLIAGQWHLPYLKTVLEPNGHARYTTLDGDQLSEYDALRVSAACCAQVSYRKLDDTLEKAAAIYTRLIESNPKHMSPTEHQGQVMQYDQNVPSYQWQNGITHARRDGSLWSANFRGWIQARQLISNEAVWY